MKLCLFMIIITFSFNAAQPVPLIQSSENLTVPCASLLQVHVPVYMHVYCYIACAAVGHSMAQVRCSSQRKFMGAYC
jgi:hypothetical protein